MHSAELLVSLPLIFTMLASVLFTCDARSAGVCRNRESCGDKCDECMWGSTFAEECNFVECGKGPGQRCGGRHNMWGKCGESLDCQCNKCHGCSSTSIGKECYNHGYNHLCLPHEGIREGLEWLRDSSYVNL
ncbi:uncharacterized protein LOC105686221 [Athalia rosae]|uniref:uncharacterized protein LOC105686221 n=1 Tax=Athalia rosae TaxID=37344 RepID=UPI002033DED7|nr:uncharacterized protein LOC105686221 [Athalia rosae]XP_048508057.1 uncharacterized protein LOC105686221 [Athalia rosae]